MHIPVQCSSCGKRFHAREELALTDISCPHCNALITIPASRGTVARPAVARQAVAPSASDKGSSDLIDHHETSRSNQNPSLFANLLTHIKQLSKSKLFLYLTAAGLGLIVTAICLFLFIGTLLFGLQETVFFGVYILASALPCAGPLIPVLLFLHYCYGVDNSHRCRGCKQVSRHNAKESDRHYVVLETFWAPYRKIVRCKKCGLKYETKGGFYENSY